MTRWAIAAALLLAACGSGKKKAPASADEAQKAWESAGMKAENFAAVGDGQALAGGRCTAGLVDGLKTVVCEYGDEAALSRGEQAAYQALEQGNATGAVVKQGKTLLLVTDSEKVDPNGKLLNKLANVFRGKS